VKFLRRVGIVTQSPLQFLSIAEAMNTVAAGVSVSLLFALLRE
jgi:hypothetical protein